VLLYGLTGRPAHDNEESNEMNAPIARRLRRGAIALALALAIPGLAAQSASATQEEYDQGYEIGLEAYKYGLPIVTMSKTYRNQTSVDVANGRGFGPPNQFNPVRQFATPDDTSVVAPNFDTLYNIAWLNLQKEPLIIHVPKIKNRYFVIPLMDPYTEDFKNLGSVNKTKPGDYAIVGPDEKNVKLPKGVKRIDSDYNRVWSIERIYADTNKSDIKKVHKYQNQTTVTPLSKYGKNGWKPKTPKNPDTTVDNPPLPSGMAYYDRLGKQLDRYPPPAADDEELAKLSEIGVGPGMTPSTDTSLSPDTVAGMEAAVADGRDAVAADITTRYLTAFQAHNGYLVTSTGSYGTDYDFRAMVTQIGLGALLPNEAIYPVAQLDRTYGALNGDKSYVIHIPEGQLPPVKAFWSLTMYDTAGFLIPNPIDRYVINDRTDLHENADGSIDLYLQSSEPSDPDQAQNWLPSPAGENFRLLWRLYATKSGAIDGILDGTGWTPPAITRVP